MKIDRNKNLFASFPQRHYRGNVIRLPREDKFPGLYKHDLSPF